MIPVGKRSLRHEREEEEYHSPRNSNPTDRATDLKEAPLPFVWNQHHHRFRRQTDCGVGGVHYILFLLDASGSIGRENFQSMTDAVSKLNAYFCRPVQVAVMTFNHEFKLEFCFNQYDNICSDRLRIRDAIRNIEYCGGQTHTAGATLCACNVLLHPICGLPLEASCISVVYITDGMSNDYSREVCDEVKCLHNRTGVETFAIGIGNVNQNELECIGNSSSISSTFRFNDFNDFVAAICQIETRLAIIRPLNPYRCAIASDYRRPGGNTCV